MFQGKAGFSHSSRLLTPAAFRPVFQQPVRSADDCFTVLCRANSLDGARLGLAISKKSAKRAVDRNRIKRIVRESFRHHQELLGNLDIVVLSRRDTVHQSNRTLRDSLAEHWHRLLKRGERNPAN